MESWDQCFHNDLVGNIFIIFPVRIGLHSKICGMFTALRRRNVDWALCLRGHSSICNGGECGLLVHLAGEYNQEFMR
jgi:hypothetical protein